MATNRFSRLSKIVTGAKTGPGEELPLLECELTRLERFAHFWVLVIQSFVRNRCFVRASALSFSTLLALIPMLAVAISVTSSLLKSEGETQIYEVIDKLVSTIMPPAAVSSNHPGAGSNLTTVVVAEIATNTALLAETNALAAALTNAAAGTKAVIIATTGNEVETRVSAQMEAAKNIHDFVQKTQSARLGIVGMLLLVWVAISMLANIEATFNDIWGVTRGRKWLWRIVLYWSVLTMGPLALVGALSLAGSSHLEVARHVLVQTPWVGELIFKFLPFAIVGLVFAVIYLTVPNTKVRPASALVGGILAGSLWQLNNALGYLYVSRVVTNNMIYGSLGLVPVFMAGLYLSWVILLFGVQVSYAFQNRKLYLQDKFAENVNQRGREFIALRQMTCLGLRYQNGQPPATAQQISAELGISTRLTEKILQTLLDARLITEVTETEAAYVPARPLETINAHQVLLAVRCVNKAEILTREEPGCDAIYGEFARIEEAERAAAAAVTMLALVNRARATLEPAAVLPSAVTLALTESAPQAFSPEPATVELTVDAVETVTDTVRPPAPARAARKIAVPEDNHDFPL